MNLKLFVSDHHVGEVAVPRKPNTSTLNDLFRDPVIISLIRGYSALGSLPRASTLQVQGLS